MELLLAVALIGILSAITFPLGATFNQKNQVRNTRDALMGYLNTARAFAQSGREGNDWGVQVTSGEIVLYSGETYATRNLALDQVFTIPNGISVTATNVTFTKNSGDANSANFTILSSAEGTQYSISVDENGNIYEN